MYFNEKDLKLLIEEAVKNALTTLKQEDLNSTIKILSLEIGLIWELKTFENKNQKYTWKETLNYIARLNTEKFGGYSDWRLPAIEELVSIVDYNSYGPAINTDYFPNTMSSWYWSSTTGAHSTPHAWCVHFYNGLVVSYDKSGAYYVRAVRSE